MSSSSDASAPFLGALIWLVSNAQVRYEGILHEIDPHKQTVTLRNVTSKGTEDRQVAVFRPPSNEQYELIVFKGNDINDLSVASPPPAVQQPQEPAEDPAIVQAIRTKPPQPRQHNQQPQHQQQQQHSQPPPGMTRSSVKSNSSSSGGYNPQQQGQGRNSNSNSRYTIREVDQNQQQQNQSRHSATSAGGRQAAPHQAPASGVAGAKPGSGTYLQTPAESAAPVDFDFASSNAKFDKQSFVQQVQQNQFSTDSAPQSPAAQSQSSPVEDGELLANDFAAASLGDSKPVAAAAAAAAVVKPAYNAKASFFDDLDESTSIQPPPRNVLRNQDVSTFGETAKQSRNQFSARGRGQSQQRHQGQGQFGSGALQQDSFGSSGAPKQWRQRNPSDQQQPQQRQNQKQTRWDGKPRTNGNSTRGGRGKQQQQQQQSGLNSRDASTFA